MNCEHCREHLLPYLYEVLEPPERERIAAHVASCAVCQETLKGARDQVGMMAEAVKPVKAEIVFKAPVKATPASTAPTLAMPRPSPRRLLPLNRWSIAAGLMFLFFTAGGAIAWSTWLERSATLEAAQNRLAKARLDLSTSQQDLNQHRDKSQAEIRAIQKELDEVFKTWKNEEAKTRANLEKERVQIIFNGPRSLLAGANNRVGVELRNQANFNQQQQGKVPNLNFDNFQQLNTRVINAKTQELLYQKNMQVKEKTQANFDLPPALPIKPNDELIIEFETQDADGKLVILRDNLKVVLPDYVTHLTSDRPMYRPGETVRFRSLTLERFSLKPPEQDFHLRFRIHNSRGEEIYANEATSQVVAGKDNVPIKGPGGQPLRGVGAGEFLLPEDLPEGQYTLSVNEVNERFNDEKRTFLVRRWQTPRFNKEINFHRTSYGPGDQVKFTVRATSLQGPMIVNNINVTPLVKVDGQLIQVDVRRDFNNFNAKDARFECTCTLPGNITKGVGTVTIKCDDGTGNHDTMVRSLPIMLRELNVDFYPEGGDLIAGVPNRVYFQARTPAQRPADFEGVIVDELQQEVARIQTLTDDREPGINQGLGVFTFTPLAGRIYRLRIESPIGIDRQVQLPLAKADGVVLHLPQGVVEDEINLTLHSAGSARELLVGAYCRGRMLDHKMIKATENQPHQVTLRPQANVGGVYRITVFEKTKDADGVIFRPLAERLVYRKNTSHVDVAITGGRASYQPGESVELFFQAQNEKKEFVPTIAMIAVVDSSVRRLADDKTERAMPTHFLLTTEIRNPEDLENADVLLGNHPKSAVALDLLLGAQGWRRFAEQDPGRFALRNQQKKAPVFLANSLAVPQYLDAEQKLIDKLDKGFVTRAVDLNKSLAEKEKDENGPRALLETVEAKQIDLQFRQNDMDNANQQVRAIRGFLYQFVLGGALLTLLFVGFYLISLGLRRLSEGGHARSWIFAGMALLSFLFLVSVIGTFVLMGEPLLDDFRFNDRDMAFKNFARAPQQPGDGVKRVEEPVVLPILDEEIAVELEQNVLVRDVKVKAAINVAQPQGMRFINDDPMNKEWVNNEFGPRPAPPGIRVADVERALRQQGEFQTLLQRQLNRRVELPPVREACVVREFAHQHKPAKNEERHDFTETVFWHPVVILEGGKAQVKFDLSDSITRYEVAILSHTLDGRLGFNRTELAAVLPFSVDPKTPIEVTENDRITIPVAVTNTTAENVAAKLTAKFKGLKLEGNEERTVELKGNESGRMTYEVTPTIREGTGVIRIAGKTPRKGDAVERKFKVVPDGFPITSSIGGTLDNGAVEHAIVMPEQWLAGSLKVQAHFYPTSLAELQSGIDAMLREPAGCFEQSSSNNYPNVLILNYLKATPHQANPLAEKRARQLMQSGYQKLIAFECIDPAKADSRRGYEWFGGTAPPHEALTAYGLLQFRDMAKVHRVELDMLQRNENYLLEQRDGAGGFKRNPRGLDQFGRAPDPVTNAYIVWALTESGVKENLDVELTSLREQCKDSKDPYFLSLVGLSHLNRKKALSGLEILRQVRAMQKEDGSVSGAKTSITGSQGRDLEIETTSLALLGWLQSERQVEFNANIQSGMKWLGQQRRGSGSFGGTQATILALKAMVAHGQKHPRNPQAGQVQITHRTQGFVPQQANIVFKGVDDLEFDGDASVASFTARSQEPITVTVRDPENFQPGRNVVQLNVGVNTMPYTLTWSYRTLKPANAEKAPVKISTKLGANPIKEGETVKLKAVVENVSGAGQGMTVAIIGLPGGLAIPDDAQQLKTLAKDGAKIGAWELRGRELVLYWRDLAPDAKIEIELDLIARLPGVYRGPASRAYLYYDADRKFWVEPLNVQITEAK